MSKQLHTAVKNILAMPYFKNEHARSGGATYGHEEAVAIRIKDAGFTEVVKTKKNYPKLKKGLLKKWARGGDDTALREATQGLPVGSYILQPAGSQGFPDILILDFNNVFVSLECKSGKTGLNPMWNDNLPNPNTIYILSSGEMDETTIFMGRDVITPEEYALMDEQEAAIAKVVKEYNLKMNAIDKFGRGWHQKSRKQHFQGGGNVKTNYFTHHNRKQCETNALEFANQ
jgi:hypothetical protein